MQGRRPSSVEAPARPCAAGDGATNALDHQADIAKVQDWLGHASIVTLRIHAPCTRPEDGPTFKVAYR